MGALTIGIPCYNEEAYIAQCVQSVASQIDANDLRLVISDNASTDRTVAVIEETLAAAPDGFADRVSLIRQDENIGAHPNFWAVYDACETEYFMWLGAHDALTANFVSATLPLVTDDPDVSMATGQPYGMRDANRGAFHVPDAVYDFSDPDPLKRYHASVRQLANCTVFHAIFRHADVRDMQQFGSGPWDHILISRLLGKGRLAYSQAGYLRRYFTADADPARAGAYAKDMVFMGQYLEDFDKVFARRIPEALRAHFSHFVFLELVNRFGLPPLARRVA